jgi:general secretion pathway protein I
MARRARAGFTLVEVLVALVVTVSVLVILAQGFSVGATASVGAQKLSRAVMLAEQKLAEYETGEASLTSGGTGDFGQDHPGYTWSVSVSAGSNNLTELTVTVSWKQVEQAQSYSIARLMRERPTP